LAVYLIAIELFNPDLKINSFVQKGWPQQIDAIAFLHCFNKVLIAGNNLNFSFQYPFFSSERR